MSERRSRAQERARAEYEANHGRPPAAAKSSSKLFNWLIVTLLTLGAGAGMVWWVLNRERIEDQVLVGQTGRPHGSVITDGAVIVFDHVEALRKEQDSMTGTTDNVTYAKTRATVVDPATGAQLAQALVVQFGGCAPASPGRLWCDVGKLELFDALTFATVQAAEVAPTTAGLGRPIASAWSVDGPLASQLLEDGRVAILDGATLAVTISETVPKQLQPDLLGKRRGGRIPMRSACNSRTLHGALMMSKAKQPPGTWTVKGRDRAKLGNGKLESTEAYLSPAVLVQEPTLVVHRSSLDSATATVQLSRLRPDGTNAWTIELGAKECENAAMVGSLFLVTTDNPERRVLAIDPELGQLRWQHGS